MIIKWCFQTIIIQFVLKELFIYSHLTSTFTHFYLVKSFMIWSYSYVHKYMAYVFTELKHQPGGAYLCSCVFLCASLTPPVCYAQQLETNSLRQWRSADDDFVFSGGTEADSHQQKTASGMKLNLELLHVGLTESFSFKVTLLAFFGASLLSRLSANGSCSLNWFSSLLKRRFSESISWSVEVLYHSWISFGFGRFLVKYWICSSL